MSELAFTWIITALETDQTHPSLSNVVKTVHWRLRGAKEEVIKELYGTVAVDPPVPDVFVSYESLTQEQVISWLEEKLEVAKLQESIAHLIALEEAPKVFILPPPWVQSE